MLLKFIISFFLFFSLAFATTLDDSLSSLSAHGSKKKEFNDFLKKIKVLMDDGEDFSAKAFITYYLAFTKDYAPPYNQLARFMLYAYDKKYIKIAEFIAELIPDYQTPSYYEYWLTNSIDTCNVSFYLTLKWHTLDLFKKHPDLCQSASEKCPAIYKSATAKSYCPAF